MTKRRVKKPTIMVGQSVSKLKGFLSRDRSAPQGYAMWFCRGDGKCPMGPIHRKLAKQKCDDCVKGDEGETVEQLMYRIEQGDA